MPNWKCDIKNACNSAAYFSVGTFVFASMAFMAPAVYGFKSEELEDQMVGGLCFLASMMWLSCAILAYRKINELPACSCPFFNNDPSESYQIQQADKRSSLNSLNDADMKQAFFTSGDDSQMVQPPERCSYYPADDTSINSQSDVYVEMDD